MRIARSLIDEIVAHAREEAPNECCGVIAARDGEAVEVMRARNARQSPTAYELDPRDLIRIWNALDDDPDRLGAIYHSHLRSPPEPSQTDINLARNWPEPLYVIVGLAGEEPEVRAFRIADGRVDEVTLEVV